jgi:hypothetical protein
MPNSGTEANHDAPSFLLQQQQHDAGHPSVLPFVKGETDGEVCHEGGVRRTSSNSLPPISWLCLA